MKKFLSLISFAVSAAVIFCFTGCGYAGISVAGFGGFVILALIAVYAALYIFNKKKTR